MNSSCRIASRRDQAKKIYAILDDFSDRDFSNLICLDLGCGNGAILYALSRYFKYSIGIDIKHSILNEANQIYKAPNSGFILATGYGLPVQSRSVDIVLCAQVYEHVTDQSTLAEEVWRVLRPGGICFFSGPNRLAIIEEHYWLPFLSWFPRPISNIYMRLFGRGAIYDAYPRYYWQIRKIWNRFVICDYSMKLLREPKRFTIESRMKKLPWISQLPEKILKLLIIFLPNYNWILIKPS